MWVRIPLEPLKQDKMENGNIGYKCPSDLFDNEIKKGTVFIKQVAQGKKVYEPTIAIGGGYHLPTEIVETWEQVFY